MYDLLGPVLEFVAGFVLLTVGCRHTSGVPPDRTLARWKLLAAKIQRHASHKTIEGAVSFYKHELAHLGSQRPTSFPVKADTAPGPDERLAALNPKVIDGEL